MWKRAIEWWERQDGKSKSRYVVIGLSVLALVALSLVYMHRQSGRDEIEKANNKKTFSVRPDDMAEGKWLTIGEDRLNRLEKAIRERDDRIKSLQRDFDALRGGKSVGGSGETSGGDIKSQINQMIKSGPVVPTLGELSPEASLSKRQDIPAPLVPTKAAADPVVDEAVKPLLPTQKDVPGQVKPPIPEALRSPAEKTKKADSGASGGGIKVYSAAARDVQDDPLAEKAAAKKDGVASFYVPSGTLTKAMILGGLDAPTMGKAKNSPMPILLRLQDYSFLPNEVRQDWEGCVLIGEGFGDLSAERAYVRVLNMSCVDRQHKLVFDNAVAGWLLDADGKNGLRGRVVTKQGTLLARSLMASFIQGLSSGFSKAATGVTTVTSGTGVVQSTEAVDDFRDGFKEGTLQGMSDSAEDLADFYMDMANEVTPVIEIGAEREVTVIFHKGFTVNFDHDLVSNNNESL